MPQPIAPTQKPRSLPGTSAAELRQGLARLAAQDAEKAASEPAPVLPAAA